MTAELQLPAEPGAGQEPAVYVLGIDPSLTGTGVARIASGGRVQVRHFGRNGKRGESLGDRADRISDLTCAVADWICDRTEQDPGSRDAPLLTVMEAPSHGSVGGSAWDRAHLWWELVRCVLPDRVATVAPATRAKWATGSGRGDKAAVAHAVGKLWPDVAIDCSDCADALALATMGAQYLGWPVKTMARHRDALIAVRWPAVVREVP